MVDLALLILRVAVGLYVFGHGAQKMLGWFGGSGYVKTLSGMIATLGFRPGPFWTIMSGVSEMGGGLLLALGLLSPLGTFGVAARRPLSSRHARHAKANDAHSLRTP